jgi:ribosomal protein S18 acetylase RimI-like enzyme
MRDSTNGPAGVTIRPFLYPDDLADARALWADSGPGVNLGRSDEPAEIEKKLERDPDLFLVAEADGKLVATVIGGFDGRRGMVYHLAVAKSHRRMGIAEALMCELESRLRAKGCVRYYLLVFKNNEGAVQFYEQLGWERMDFIHVFARDIE